MALHPAGALPARSVGMDHRAGHVAAQGRFVNVVANYLPAETGRVLEDDDLLGTRLIRPRTTGHAEDAQHHLVLRRVDRFQAVRPLGCRLDGYVETEIPDY